MQNDIILENLKRLQINYFVKDIHLNYSECNESTARYAGLDSPQQICGKSDYEFPWKETSAESFRQSDKDAINDKPQINFLEKNVLAATGTEDFLVNKTKLLDDNENVIGIVGCNICVSGFTLTKKAGAFSKEEERLYLGEEFGHVTLSRRQLHVFRCLIDALTVPQIALYLKISISRVRRIICDLKVKLQCQSRAEIVLTAIKQGWTYLISDLKLTEIAR